MKQGVKVTILFLIIFIFSFSFPFVDTHAMELTMQECILMAIEKNTGLKANEMDVLSSEEDIKISSSNLLPSLKLKGNYILRDRSDVSLVPRDTFLSGIPPEDIELSADNREMYHIGLSIEQPVFTGSRLTHSFVKSKILSEEAHHSFERQKKLLIFEVKKAFYEALKEQLYKEILNKVIKSKKEGLRVIEERLKEGYIQREEVMIAETDLSTSEFDLFKTKNRADYALSRLKKLMDYQGDDQLILAGEPINGYLSVSLQEAKEFALKNREDLKMSVARTQVAQKDIEIAKSGFFPQISLEGRYFVQKETNVTRPDAWILTAKVDWPLFEWNRTKSEVKKASALRQKMRYEHEELIKRVMLDAEESWRITQEKVKEVGIKESKLKTAEYSFKQATEKYAEGVIKLVDLLNAETEFLKTYNEYLIIINDFNIALAQLETSISGMQDHWFSREEIYKPDFQSVSNIMKEVIKNKERPVREGKPVISMAEDAEELGKNLTIEKEVNNLSSESDVKDYTQDTFYAIQVGAFKTKQAAEKFRKSLLKRIIDKKIVINQQRGFYKVRIIGFRDREEASLLRDSGIEGFIIKSVY